MQNEGTGSAPSGGIARAERWKVIGARVAGPSHLLLGLPCQDAFRVEVVGGDILVGALCDGAGSARFAEAGARIVAAAVVEKIIGELRAEPGMPIDIRRSAERAVIAARDAITRGLPEFGEASRLRDFNATLLGCIADGEGGWFFHIGDGVGCAMPVASESGEPLWEKAVVSSPANGEYANETFFVTEEDWADNLRITGFEAAGLILLMSDGAMPFAMTAGCGVPEPRFMAAVDRFLLSVPPAEGEDCLAATLDTEGARRVSGDDKTLVWARRVNVLS
jgi:hypothetical protein